MVKSKIHNMCLCPEELIHRPLVQIKKWFSIPVSNSHVNNLMPELSFRPSESQGIGARNETQHLNASLTGMGDTGMILARASARHRNLCGNHVV